MSTSRGYRKTVVLACSTALTTTLIGLLAGPVQAAPVTVSEKAQPDPVLVVGQQAQAAPAYTFAIAAQPLDAALDAFVQATGWQLGYESAMVSGVMSAGVDGRLPADEALNRLLAGTGLTFRQSAPGMATLETLATGEEATLGPVTIEALRGITSYEPTEGYVSYFSVAATKTDTPLIETPQSISVISRQEMDDHDVKTVAEAVRYNPGIAVDAYGVDPRGFDSIKIRGFDSVTTGSFRDGLRMDGNFFAAYTTEPYALERVDIMRGPSGALYGQAEAGGVINRTTKRPTAGMRQEAFIEAGSYNTYSGGFDVGGAATEDKTILFRLTGMMRQGNMEFDYNDGTEQDNDRVYFAPSLTWAPTENTELTLLTDYLKDSRSTQFGTFASEETGRTNTVAGEPGFDKFDQEQYAIGYTFSHRFDEMWSVRQTARYSHVEVDYQTVAANGLDADGRTLNRYVWASPDIVNQIAVDNQVESRFGLGPTDHVVLVGGDYSRSVDTFSYYSGAVGDLDIWDPVYTGASLPAPYQVTEQILVQSGVYAQDQVTLFDKWILTLGGRYSWVDQTTEQKLAGTTENKTDSAFTGRAGLTYMFDNGLAPYVSYTEGFAPTEGTNLSGESFEPQRSVQYEVGLKYQPPETNALLTVSLYHLTKSNVLTRDPDNINASIQSGEIRSRGVEVEGKASLFNGLDIHAAYTYTDAKVTESTEADLNQVPILVPDHTASVWMNYKVSEGPLKGLGIGGGVRYVGSTFNDLANTSSNPDYALVDATISYALTDSASVEVNANNLLDTEYVTTCSFGACYYGPGRRVNARLTYRW